MAPQPGLEPGTNADLIRVQSVALATELLKCVSDPLYLSTLYFRRKKTCLKSRFLNVAPQPGLEPGTNAEFKKSTVRCSSN